MVGSSGTGGAPLQSPPILLFGMPRSGTTWIGKIFDSHPDTLYRHEPDTAVPMAQIPLLADAGELDVHRDYIAKYLREMQWLRAERVCGKQPIFPKRYLSWFGLAAYRTSAGLSKSANRLDLDMPVLFAPDLGASRAVRLVWKSIESLGRLGLVVHAVPDAQAIHIVRHPCGYVSSVLKGEAARRFTHGGASEDYGIFEMLCDTEQGRRHGVTLEHLRTLQPCERLAWRWLLFNEKALDDTRGDPRVLQLNYERLCADPVGVTRELFRFCDLPWERQSEEFVGASTSTSRKDYYSVFKDPLVSAWKWQKDLSQDDARRVLDVASRSEVGQIYLKDPAWIRSSAAA